MSLKRWLGLMLARLVALAVAALGAWVLVRNVTEPNYEGWALAYIVLTSLSGLVGGILFLLTIDGPRRFRVPSWRMWGWWLMLASVIHTTVNVIAIPFVAVVFPGLPWMRSPEEDPGEMLTSQ